MRTKTIFHSYVATAFFIVPNIRKLISTAYFLFHCVHCANFFPLRILGQPDKIRGFRVNFLKGN